MKSISNSLSRQVFQVVLSIVLVVSLMPALVHSAYADEIEDAQSSSEVTEQAAADQTSSKAETQALGFVYFEEADLIAGAPQKVAIAIDNDAITIGSAVLTYQDPTGAQHELSVEKCADSAALFTLQTEGAGTYQLLSMVAQATTASGEQKTYSLDLAKEGANCAFEAQQDTGMALSAQSEAEEVSDGDMSIYALNDEGELEGTSDLDAAAGIVAAAAAEEGISAQANDGTIVVALDPGHGGTDPGATSNGLNEADVNWKIAQACKAELEKYQNVRVYMTRTQNELPGLTERVRRAAEQGATVFVSIHINSAAATSAHGAEVWYPNDSSYNKDAHTTGKELSQKILNELTALGLSDRGIKTKDTQTNSKYPDGSVRDYYTVIANARERGIPGIIVEHAFISNPEENKKLADDAFLRQLGQADARGIVKTFDLQKKGGAWQQQADGTWKYQYTNGSYAVNTWVTDNKKQYWIDANGTMVTGVCAVEGKVYHFDSSGVLQTTAGWKQLNGNWYYFTKSGAAQTGWVKSGGKWYYQDPASGVMKTGWVDVSGKKYFLTASGAMRSSTGWFNDGGNWYWITGSGAAATGWVKSSSKWYYLDPASAVMKTGWVDVSGKKYFLNSSGAMRGSGWFKQDAGWYWITGSGAAATGWAKVKGKWYYLDPASALMKTGWVDVSGKKYFLNSSGAMRTSGWFKQDAGWYWITRSGAAATGWAKVKSKWYYLDPASALMKTGWQKVDDAWYYLNANGDMKTGWFKQGSTWYYLKGSGAMAVGWQTVNGKQYYFDADGKMLTGEHNIDGKPCFFEASGAFIGNGTPIMGVAKTNAATMTNAFVRQLALMGKSYPSDVLGAGGAPDPATFCKIIYEEATAEGVRPEVVWAQVMWETGWLQMGGDVKLSQYNFAGLGATGNGVAGAGFPDVRTGIRAQVQHLKCYACTDALNNDRVDPRWSSSLRGKAKLVEWLGIPENPFGTGWAASAEYGYNLRGLMKDKLGI